MKRCRKIVMMLSMVFLAAITVSAQNPVKQLHFINPEKKKVKIRFKFLNNLIIIPVKINNSDTLNFILDTGLTTSLITELGYNDSLELNYARKLELQGLGRGEPLQALHSFGNSIKLKGIQGENQDFYVLMNNIFHLSSKLGMEINGILGYSLFDNFVVGINYNRKTITFYNPKYSTWKRRERRYSSIPLTMHETKPYLNMTIEDADGDTFRVKMLLDTGASHALWLNRSSLPGLSLPERQRYSYLGSGLNGQVYGTLTRLKRMTIDDYQLENVIVSFPDSLSVAHALGLDRRNGSVGAEILKRFNLIINYPDQMISIKKNSLFRENFKQNLSGMEVIAPIPEIHTYMVDDVRNGSPADEAGIQKGDILLYINGVPVRKLTLNEIYGILQSKPGRTVKIDFRRGSQEIKTKLTLEDFI